MSTLRGSVHIRKGLDTKASAIECVAIASHYFEQIDLDEGKKIFLAYAKERILDFLGERGEEYAGQGLYLLPNFYDFLRRSEQKLN